jgi:lysophospholipase L1-like esterase
MNLAQKSIRPLALLFLSLFALLLPSQVFAAPATTIPQDNPTPRQFGWDKECDARIAAAQGQPIDLIFVGDSITQNFVEKPTAGWNLVGASVWNSHYANKNALNLGVGSDGTEHILWRLDHSDIKSFNPKVVVLLAGVNDMQYSAEDIAAGVKAVLNKIESLYPNAKIVLMNILPNGRDMAKTNAANQIIDTFVDNKTVFSLDLAPEMTPQGDSWKGIGGDHVHLTEEGYKIWASQLDQLLDKLSEML